MLCLHEMEGFEGSRGIIKNLPSRNKSTLILGHHIKEDLFEPISYGFVDELEQDVA